ncbi:hypothetical protein [Spirillospora sp. CA-294931]|uniref:hypothetical protein n=1 Tax=Spirillospora sp. CA-294931 TaxID=3240042 RepID=UPI003D8AD8E5
MGPIVFLSVCFCVAVPLYMVRRRRRIEAARVLEEERANGLPGDDAPVLRARQSEYGVMLTVVASFSYTVYLVMQKYG